MNALSAKNSRTGYQRKIKTRDELQEIIGPFPRAEKVIMCHGTFDLVHPGHIRHLMYARSKADLLVVSITSDAWVQKSDFRPFVPQDLRALNLAALEVVDYVIIDDNATPIENLLYLQPDYFAKGYEYQKGKVPPKTQEEIDTLSSYGGQMLFTPGDVASLPPGSSRAPKPDLSIEKLVTLMESEGVTFDSLRECSIASRGEGTRGRRYDVDSYVYTTPISTGSSKTPTLSVHFNRQVDYAGARRWWRSTFGGRRRGVSSTVLGDDDLMRFIRADLEEERHRLRAIIDGARCTTQKWPSSPTTTACSNATA